MRVFRKARVKSPVEPEAFAKLRDGVVHLRVPSLEDYRSWATLREASRAFLRPFEPIWPADDLTKRAFRRRLRFQANARLKDESYHFLIIRNLDEALLGGIVLGDIRRGVAQMGALGYWIGAPFKQEGYMTRAVSLLCAFGFHDLKLHRIEAACLPHNTASQKLLHKCGFEQEGTARAYLKINGAWQDHLLFAKIAPQE